MQGLILLLPIFHNRPIMRNKREALNKLKLGTLNRRYKA